MIIFSNDSFLFPVCFSRLMTKGEDEPSIQIVYMAISKNSAASHIQTLASVMGSEMAAKKAIIYDYTRTMNGFAAKLTADQITALLIHRS
ncbi:hypothetical protein ACSBR1_013614 [Camellia fascicularis]